MRTHKTYLTATYFEWGERSMINLSIIIPHYNSAALLRKLLHTIPRRDDFQVIVIDDNSTKETELLECVIIDNSHCEFYINDTGVQSAGAARNVGMRHAVGKWLMFADADDYFLHGWEKVVEEYFESEDDYIFFGFKYFYRDTGEEVESDKKCLKMINDFFITRDDFFLRYQGEAPWARIIKHSLVVNNCIYFDQTMVSNDNLFCCKCGFYAKKISANPNYIYVYTKSPPNESLTQRADCENWKIRRQVLIDKYYFLKVRLPKREFAKLSFPVTKLVCMSSIYCGFIFGGIQFVTFIYNGITLGRFIRDFRISYLTSFVKRMVDRKKYQT